MGERKINVVILLLLLSTSFSIISFSVLDPIDVNQFYSTTISRRLKEIPFVQYELTEEALKQRARDIETREMAEIENTFAILAPVELIFLKHKVKKELEVKGYSNSEIERSILSVKNKISSLSLKEKKKVWQWILETVKTSDGRDLVRVVRQISRVSLSAYNLNIDINYIKTLLPIIIEGFPPGYFGYMKDFLEELSKKNLREAFWIGVDFVKNIGGTWLSLRGLVKNSDNIVNFTSFLKYYEKYNFNQQFIPYATIKEAPTLLTELALNYVDNFYHSGEGLVGLSSFNQVFKIALLYSGANFDRFKEAFDFTIDNLNENMNIINAGLYNFQEEDLEEIAKESDTIDDFVSSLKYKYLISGAYYELEKLLESGYELKVINLEGIVLPELLLEYEDFLVHEISKENNTIGWLWESMFLNERDVRRKFREFVEKHAEIDNVIISEELSDAKKAELDQERHRLHLWANIFGKIFNKKIGETTSAINWARYELKKSEINVIINENAGFAIGGMVVLDFIYVDKKQKSSSSSFWYEGNSPKEYNKFLLIAEYLKEKGWGMYETKTYEHNAYIEVELTDDELDAWNEHGDYMPGQDIHTLPSNYYQLQLHKKTTIFIPKEILPIVLEQISYLKEAKDVYAGDVDVAKIVLSSIDWDSKLTDEMRIAISIFREGNKGHNLKRLEDVGFSIPEFWIVSPEDSLDGLGLEEKVGIYRDLETDEILVNLVSARSSPVISMPGLLTTVLNVGVTDENIKLLADKCGERFAYETYAIFLRSFGSSVFGIDEKDFDSISSAHSAREIAEQYKQLIEERGFEVPQSPYRQLEMAVKAARDSWNSEVAVQYRVENNIPDDLGTAVVVQAMVYGNLNENSGSFVMFTRHPITGEKGIYLNYVQQSQGIDIVSGRVNPLSLEESGLSEEAILRLRELAAKIEDELGYVQDIEGVIEDGKIWILQSRDAILSPEAEVRVLVEMVEDGAITREELFRRIDLDRLEERLKHLYVDPQVAVEPIISGQPASTGAVGGVIVFNLESVQRYKKQGCNVILVKREFDPFYHIAELRLSNGLLTQVGGDLSHGAIQGRGHNIPTVVGAAIEIDSGKGILTIGDKIYQEGDYITLDGTNGLVYERRIHLIHPESDNAYLKQLKEWAEDLL